MRHRPVNHLLAVLFWLGMYGLIYLVTVLFPR